MTIPAIFLDRDGTIIVERHYLSDPGLVALEHGAAEGLGRLAGLGYPLIVVSNQSGVGRGYFTEDAVRAVDRRVAELLAERGITMAGWYFCPHGPDQDCDCRKPLPGMLNRARDELGIDLSRSIIVGDKASDIEAGEAVGARGILVTTGHGPQHAAWAERMAVPVCADLLAASDVIVEMLGASAPGVAASTAGA